ncbi:uncharacterized protein BDR25DRAFT_342187 [Lindgomyces ingoldianus]|uniref:Uncharacterized protein n=1 Tax=Lindgomyces ingoldianus TaxID=673940 RepID=A0ACB6R050_9PLEO|nr:uncharacterized protein BDR25DRAFT_342187 [Lindgomyces ingoldianus]KAF2472208.1 hypothetical protein BDR25DRAFT_342187 [Lindgomyces ingoldianus]
MSSVLSSVAANPTGVCSTQAYSQLPGGTDNGCAIASTAGLPSNYSDAMSKCCKDAPVEKWASDCALWCLASGQSIGDLTTCLQKESVVANMIFCRGNTTATATGKVSGSGTVKATGTSSQTGTAASSASGKSTSSPGAAPRLMTQQSVSKAGVGMLVVLFISAAAGALI